MIYLHDDDFELCMYGKEIANIVNISKSNIMLKIDSGLLNVIVSTGAD